MGWASGFNAGTRMARTWIDTYNQAKDEEEFNRIRDEKPQVSEGFTAEQGDQLRAAAESGLYDIGFKNGRYTVTPKSEPGNEGYVAPQTVTDMFGERRAGMMSPRQIEYQRQAQMAGAVSRRNPLAGARMMRELDQGEREQAQHELGMKTGELGLRRAQRQDTTEEEAVGFQRAVGQYIKEGVADPQTVERDRLGINANHPRYTITSAADPKTGKPTGQYNFITVDDKGNDRSIPLNFMQMAEARALIMAMEQYPGQSMVALQRLAAINKDVAEAVARDNNMRLEAFKAGDTANYHTGMVRAANRNADAAWARAGQENAALKKLNELDALGQSEAGNEMGLQRALAVGATKPTPYGPSAADIYRERRAGDRARIQALSGRVSSDKPAMSMADFLKAVDTYGHVVVGRKNGAPVLLRDAPIEVQRQYIEAGMQGRNPDPTYGPSPTREAQQVEDRSPYGAPNPAVEALRWLPQYNPNR